MSILPFLNIIADFRSVCKSGDLDNLKRLLEEEKYLKWLDGLIIEAAKYGHLEMVRYLYEKGDDPQSCSNSPIIHASRRGHFKVVEYLISIGADPNSGLLPAVEYEHIDIVILIVQAGSTIDLEGAIKTAKFYRLKDIYSYLTNIKEGKDDFIKCLKIKKLLTSL
jgi:ankyrin repeat protein